MDILIYVAFFISIPVFYIIGLATFIRSFGKKTPATPALTADIVTADKIRAISADAPPEVSLRLNALADQLGGVVNRAHMIMPGDTVQVATPLAPPPAPKMLARNVGDVMHELDNINLILYLGAFLIVVSAGIFVGYNFEALSGVFKTIFLGIFAALFYTVGLLLFIKSPKLRAAGVTFTGIGLILLPLIGLAAYNFTALHDHGPATWFVTSIITLAAYIATIIVTRQTYIAYLMAFTTLSLFESSVSLLNLPIHWYGWGLAAVGMVLLMLGRRKLLWEDASSALVVTANIFIPLALVFSLFTIESDGLSQLGVTIGLSGFYYLAMAQYFFGKKPAELYWGLALAFFPAALGIGFWTSLSRSGIAVIILGVCGVYLLIEHLLPSKLPHQWREEMAMVTGLMPLAGVLVMYDNANAIFVILIAAVLINGELAYRLRQSGLGLLAILSFLTLPYVYAFGILRLEEPWGIISACMLVAALPLVWWSRRMADWPESGRAIGQSGYCMALIASVVVAFFASSTVLLEVGLVAAGIWYVLSLTESEPYFIYASAATLYLAMLQPGFIGHWSGGATALLLMVTGAALYAIGAVEPNSERALALRYSGLIGPYLGSIAGLFSETPRIEPVLSTAVGGGLLWAEGRRQFQPSLKEAAEAIWVLSLDWAFYVWGIDQLQAYTLPWAAYVALLAYRRRSQGHEIYDGLVAVALGIMTIPLAGQALADDGQLYGLLLIFEAIALVFAGIGMSYKLIRTWGVTTLVIEVLYQMKDVFLAMPKYLISASLGLVLLIVAIILLQRRKGGI